MIEKIVRGVTFVRTTTIAVEAFWPEEGGMGEDCYGVCETVEEAYKVLEEAKTHKGK